MSEADPGVQETHMVDELGPDTAEEAEAEEEANPPSQEPAQEPGEGGGEAEPVEGHPAEPQGLSQKQLEQAFGKLERETERHAKRVAEIMGNDAAMLSACPLCDPLIPGFVMPTPATPERFPAVRQFMGDSQPRELRPDPDASRCESCGGEGVVDTGSKVPGQEALPCKRCDGFGWTGPRRSAGTVTGPTVAAVTESNGQTTSGVPQVEPAEAAALRAKGYTLIPPVGVTS